MTVKYKKDQQCSGPDHCKYGSGESEDMNKVCTQQQNCRDRNEKPPKEFLTPKLTNCMYFAELYYDRGNHHEFVSLVKDLARPGEITQSQTFDFEFTHVEKPYESYTGQNVKLRYFLRATISRRLNDITKEMDIVVHTLSTYPEINSSIKMEVGIEDCLHIEFEYNKSKYHLKDVIVGKIYFLLVRIKIKHMEIDIIKRETTGTGPNVYHENDTIAKYEIMDGAPVRVNLLEQRWANYGPRATSGLWGLFFRPSRPEP
nr:PREDICTED: vacuolar protein sorting-associated protein 26B-like [Latimeria chalumnae]|eukprot:XP_014353775.1 PREDICTED: vacuolar protein sorting-associated protein 26B-like [Latimeria chalumnae]